MATPDRDTIYNPDGTKKTVYEQDYSSSTGWIVGGIIVVALVVIAYFVFSGRPATTPTGVEINNTPAVTAPATPGPADKAAAPSTSNTPSTNATPATPATPAPSTDATKPATPAAPAAPATAPAAPATSQ